jgi:hypothetical protein
MKYSPTALFRLCRSNVSAKGASFIVSLGQAPQDVWTKKTPALKVRLAESRFQRFVTDVIRIPGAFAPGLCEKSAVGANQIPERERQVRS